MVQLHKWDSSSISLHDGMVSLTLVEGEWLVDSYNGMILA